MMPYHTMHSPFKARFESNKTSWFSPMLSFCFVLTSFALVSHLLLIRGNEALSQEKNWPLLYIDDISCTKTKLLKCEAVMPSCHGGRVAKICGKVPT